MLEVVLLTKSRFDPVSWKETLQVRTRIMKRIASSLKGGRKKSLDESIGEVENEEERAFALKKKSKLEASNAARP